MPDLLSVENVTKIYQKGQVPGLNKVSFNVREGEFVGIMGASGSGKTTLLNVLSTIDKPTEGDIKIKEINIKDLKENAAADFRSDNIGFVFLFRRGFCFYICQNYSCSLYIRSLFFVVPYNFQLYNAG